MNTELEEVDQEQGDPTASSGMRPLLAEFVALEKRRRDAEGEAESIAEQIKKIEPLLREEMELCGMTNARCDGLTVFIKTDQYVSKKAEFTTEQVCDVLRTHGLDYMVGEAYSAATLKSKVVEWLKEGHDVPEKLAEMLNIGKTVKLSTRK